MSSCSTRLPNSLIISPGMRIPAKWNTLWCIYVDEASAMEIVYVCESLTIVIVSASDLAIRSTKEVSLVSVDVARFQLYIARCPTTFPFSNISKLVSLDTVVCPCRPSWSTQRWIAFVAERPAIACAVSNDKCGTTESIGACQSVA